MWRTALGLVLAAGMYAGVPGGEVVAPLPNGGFEEGAAHWRIDERVAMTRATSETAASGKWSLKIVDKDKTAGSSAFSEPVAIAPGKAIRLRARGYCAEGSGLGVYVRILDADKKWLGKRGSFNTAVSSRRMNEWQDVSLTIYPPEEGAWAQVWVHSYNAAQVTGYLDDIHFVLTDLPVAQPPWEPAYKMRPHETERLTAADVPGPDGIVYPDWSGAGVQGGIPDVAVVARAGDYGAVPDDDRCDSRALERACDAAGAKGGGAVLLQPGVYHLDRPFTIYDEGVVLRGAGRGKTRIVCRYDTPAQGAVFHDLSDGERIGPATLIDLRAEAQGLTGVRVTARQGEREVVVLKRGNSVFTDRLFSCRVRASRIFGKLDDGEAVLEGRATYADGPERVARLRVALDSAFDGARQVSSPEAAIVFQGRGPAGPRRMLVRDGRRGDLTLALESTSGLAAGDKVWVVAPATERWKAITENTCPWGAYREMEAVVTDATSETITLNQPLRIDYPTVDGSYVREVSRLERVGIEDLAIEHTNDLWMTSVFFRNVWNGWARRVDVTKCGRKPVSGSQIKWCEVRDCVFDSSWHNSGAGAYVGWEHAWDCLMDNVTTYKMRHAPVFQWATSGCVIRNSTFHHGEGQWHAGWTNENLIENSSIRSRRAYGSYGYGMWASPPDDVQHGPNGPRNVVYNCRVDSEKAGVWLGGMNENWLFLYNRFEAADGPGFESRPAGFDHILKGNVFVLHDEDSPMVFLAAPNCTGIELIGNRLYGGNGRLCDGLARPAVADGNTTEALAAAPSADAMPEPPVPSIYLWQKEMRGMRQEP